MNPFDSKIISENFCQINKIIAYKLIELKK